MCPRKMELHNGRDECCPYPSRFTPQEWRAKTYHPFGTETLVTATLKDVAQRAGVSIKTVSNVVHGYAHVTEEMRERVRAALEELNYQPNLPARYLRNGRVGVLAFAIPDLSNPYFADVGHAIIAAASARSYTVLIDCTGGERAHESLVLDGLRPHLIDGVILIPFALES